jgi:RHS repeat-associated protein
MDVATLGNGLTVNYTRNNANQVTNVANKNGSTVLSNYAITPDNAGNPKKVIGPSGTTFYGYDDANRLTSACSTLNCSGTTSGTGYTYDAAGNRLTQVNYGASTTTTTYRYNADNQLCWTVQGTSSNACNSAPGGATSYGYDVNGDQTSAGNRTFTYDTAGRMLTTTQSGSTQAYTYDGSGSMLTRSVGGVTQSSYLWDPNAPMPMMAIERDGSGNGLRRYLYAPGGPGGLLSMRSGGSNYYYLPDGLGSVGSLTSSTGALQWSYDYEGYGTTKTATKNDPNAPVNPMGFGGQYQDPTTSLYNLRARQYDASTGRFLSTDPLEATSGGRIVSTYGYAFDQPTALSDPTGLSAGSADWFSTMLCGGPCSDTLADTWTELYADWRAGPMLPKIIGGVMIAVGGGFIACTYVSAGCAALAAQPLFQKGEDVAASTPVGSASLPLNLATSAENIPSNARGIFDGIQFSGHAFDKMQSFGISPTAAVDVVRSGEEVVEGGSTYYYGAANNLSVVVNSVTGRVITVSYGYLKPH